MIAAPSGVHHFAVKVLDLPRAEAFYREVLRLTVLRRWQTAEGGAERSVWLDVGGGTFLALEQGGGGVRETAEDDPGHHLVALRIEGSQRAAWLSRLAAAGVEVYRRTSFTLYVRDPEGNRIALSHYPEPADALDNV